jgi:hypothetical protein
MCIMIYIASDQPLPTAAWDPSRRRFQLTELSEGDEPVRRQFSKPCVYLARSHEGCGCGFQYGEYEEDDEDDTDLTAKRVSRRQLADFLTAALQKQPEIELFACWDGDQAAPAEHRERLRPADLVRERTFFREKELLVVSNGR